MNSPPSSDTSHNLTYTRIWRASTVRHGPSWAEPNLPLFRVEVGLRQTNYGPRIIRITRAVCLCEIYGEIYNRSRHHTGQQTWYSTVSLKARSTGKLPVHTIDGETSMSNQQLQPRGAAKPVRQVFSRRVFPRFHISSFLISCFLISHSCFYQYPIFRHTGK